MLADAATPVKPVTMTCMTTKKKFEVEQPEVVVLKNGRFAFRAECPWEGKNGKKLCAFKFCSLKDYEEQCERNASTSESEHLEAKCEHDDAAESEQHEP